MENDNLQMFSTVQVRVKFTHKNNMSIMEQVPNTGKKEE